MYEKELGADQELYQFEAITVKKKKLARPHVNK
jgi:hypothetical protein